MGSLKQFCHLGAEADRRTVPKIPKAKPAAERQELLIAHLVRYHAITISTYMTLTSLTRRRANAELTAFVDSGLLACQGTLPHLLFVKNETVKYEKYCKLFHKICEE